MFCQEFQLVGTLTLAVWKCGNIVTKEVGDQPIKCLKFQGKLPLKFSVCSLLTFVAPLPVFQNKFIKNQRVHFLALLRHTTWHFTWVLAIPKPCKIPLPALSALLNTFVCQFCHLSCLSFDPGMCFYYWALLIWFWCITRSCHFRWSRSKKAKIISGFHFFLISICHLTKETIMMVQHDPGKEQTANRTFLYKSCFSWLSQLLDFWLCWAMFTNHYRSFVAFTAVKLDVPMTYSRQNFMPQNTFYCTNTTWPHSLQMTMLVP